MRLQGPDSLLEFGILLLKASLFQFDLCKVSPDALDNAALVLNNAALVRDNTVLLYYGLS